MSVKTKLSLFITLLVSIVLTLNIAFYYITTRSELLLAIQRQSQAFASQIGATLEVSQQAKNEIELEVGSRLRASAVAARELLPPAIDRITNDDLVRVSAQVGVDHITLWVREDEDIVVRRSSEPAELGMSAKTWDYWFTAFHQLFDLEPVTVKEGQTLAHYWSGPYNFATSDPGVINKWGYYYDGSTDYMINPYVNADTLLQFEHLSGTEAVLQTIVSDNPAVVEIAGLDPEFFGKDPILKLKKGQLVHNLDVRGVLFGSYGAGDEAADIEALRQAVSSGEMTTVRTERADVDLVRYIIPMSGAFGEYAIGIAFDRAMLQKPLFDQLLLHTAISAVLVLVTLVVSYVLAGLLLRPIHEVLRGVGAIASGNFGTTIGAAARRDELGLLAGRINAMSDSLGSYLRRVNESAEELRSTKEYLQSFIDHTSDAIHVSDLSDKVLSANRAFETIYGWRPEQIVGQRLTNIPEELQAEYASLIARMQRGEAVNDYETVRLTRSGEPIDVSLTISPIRDSAGQMIAVASISRNITARKQTEEMIRRSEKLSVIGQLAAGVAHEIRNPLTTLRGFVQLHQTKGTLSKAYLDIMLDELDRINFIISEFLVLAKPQVTAVSDVDVRETLRALVVLLDSEAGLSGVNIETDYNTDQPYVRGEANQLKQVFLNVMKNAIEAMPGGGRLTIALGAEGADRIAVRFADTGVGMSEETLRRIGEPFFTTKEEGTGLGLMVSQQIVANHKGDLRIDSAPGAGTTVEILLPCIGQAAPSLPGEA
ncbi:PAS domain S-box protein [Paenibacillus sp. IB182496]|uniref:histidine kinase n=1 Tax=Paenibacillus sabuli TaxID=2772509 RepID=A0A927BW09_9BACL|nr:HAMP domain-containing sensor histidine kinase [Paenibacillus sabuli]MBD2846936.1 PAS domain S-box protein [Paenibacillus sabuli]